MRPNHHQFIAFAYVVREGSFSGAAARLGVTQSTVTQHVAKLEQNVGSQLLIRSKEGVEVTSTGKDFYDLADRLVSLDSEIEERLKGYVAMREGRIKVIANAPQPALEIIARFTRRFPEINIEFGLHDWTTATMMIRNRLADVGIITDPPQNNDWVMHRIQSTGYVAYCRPDNALAARKSVRITDLADQTVILPESGSLTRRVVNARLKALGLAFPRIISMKTFPLMCEAVLQGIGVAIFLRRSSQIAQGLVELDLEEFSECHETWLVVTRDRSRLRLISEFRMTVLSGVM